jgi:hypothetical protein
MRQRKLFAGAKSVMEPNPAAERRAQDDRDDKHLMRAKAAGNPLQPKSPHWLPI